MRTFKYFSPKTFFILLILLSNIFSFSCGSKMETAVWSVRMADSVMKRNPEPWMIDFREAPKWEYTQGLVLKSILEVWKSTNQEKYFQYVKSYYDKFVDSTGNIMLYSKEEYNIDRINPGKPLFLLYEKTGNLKFKQAIFLLRDQMRTHPRTNVGGFWHKKKYPNQMWLDGLYMGSPFLAEFAKTFNELELFDDVVHQIITMEKYARDEKTGLLYHAWDESRQQRWADPETGQSPNFWGRSMGWYAMALVDVLDFLPENHPKRPDVIAIMQRLAEAITKFQDEGTGLWYQVLDKGGKEGNYLESSASCMFTYSLFKAVRNKYIDPKFLSVAQKAYHGIIKNFIEVNQKELVDIHKGCAVAGLGGDPYRDGSYEYYIGEKIITNDAKAVGPFILASLEFEIVNK